MDKHRSGTSGSRDDPLQVIIIGAGFGGVGMAIRLKQAGVSGFEILERSGDIGGCWRDNTYPGAACDVPSHLYSFSFEPKSDWSRRFAPQHEILDYIRFCARKYGLAPHIRLHTEVCSVVYDEGGSLWQVLAADGRVRHARHVVTACGQLSQPAVPRIEGKEGFAGPQFHSAHWRHDVDLRGKHVAVIGTGASAIQFVPQIAPQVKRLSVFQRSAPYVLPKPDRPYSGLEKKLFEGLPGWRLMTRGAIYTGHELRAIGFTKMPGVMKWVERQCRSHLRREIADEGLRRALTPDYPAGCKRVLISNDFYPAMARRNVDLVTSDITHIGTSGVLTADGAEHPADVIIYGTGFAATEFLAPIRVEGRGAVRLKDVWRGGAQAYLGISVPGFPNFFMLYGPNTNLGHSSIVYMLESQIDHVIACLRALGESGARSIEVRREAYGRYDVEVQRAVERTVWDGGCTSWYRNESGRNTNNWPGFTFSYRRLAHSVLADAYAIE